MAPNTSPVQATTTAFRIIEALRLRDGAGVSELAAALEMPTSTVHDHLRTLEAAEYLTSEDGVYAGRAGPWADEDLPGGEARGG
jgi:DNA-binding MarR family transcriptional regulator